MENNYDVIIIGAGPAGLTASIYASRYKLSNIVIGKTLGGELSLAHKIENYPGFIAVSGLELADKWKKQAEELGAKVLLKEAIKIEKIPPEKLPGQEEAKEGKFKVLVGENEAFYSKTLIVATGSERRRLNIPGEEKYLGRGVSYCTTCDAPFFKGKTVALVGGSDSAVSGAVHTAEFAQKVYLIYRRDKLRAEPMWQEEWQKIVNKGKGETIYNTNITEILGDTVVKKLKLDTPYKGLSLLEVDGVFIEIGGVPGTALIQPLGVELDDTGHLKVNNKLETNIKGLFAAGDMTSLSIGFKQAIWAMAQGAKAANSAYQFIKKQTAPPIRGV